MICIQKVKGKNSLWPDYRRRIPTNPQQLTEGLQERTSRAHTKTNADEVVAGKVNNGDPLGLWIDGTSISVVTEIDDKPETFETCVLEETIIP